MNILTRNIYIISKMIGTSKKDGSKFTQLSYIETDKILNSKKDSKFVGYIVKTAFLQPEYYDGFTVGEAIATLEFNDMYDKFSITGVTNC